MKTTQRTARALLLAALLVPALQGCATAGYWKWAVGMDDTPSYTGYELNTKTSEQRYVEGMSPAGAAAMIGIFVTPVTLAFDILTLPVQISEGYGPFAKDD